MAHCATTFVIAAGMAFCLVAQVGEVAGEASSVAGGTVRQQEYILGPEDRITLRSLTSEEISEKPIDVDRAGWITVPLIGRVPAQGFTATELERVLNARLKHYIKDPQVSVQVSEYGSQPVSVLGAVNKPGIQQLRGHKTLVEILSVAGGIAPEAGYAVTITRRAEMGGELPGATPDATGAFLSAKINLDAIMNARAPEQNVAIRPHDVITVPRGEMVYVMGEVRKPGGFVLRERESMSILQAVSLAEGLTMVASGKARILREESGSPKRIELAADVQSILAGKIPDVALRPNDIVFIPKNRAKTATLRAIETGIQIGTGVMIWRR